MTYQLFEEVGLLEDIAEKGLLKGDCLPPLLSIILCRIARMDILWRCLMSLVIPSPS